jgi:hypothetical protein
MICVPRFYPGAGPAGGGGAAPDVTVATFADLPTTRPDGYLVAVTAQSGLTEVIVRWDDGGGVWLLEQATCAYTVHRATEWVGLGEWYDTGGITVNTADGATIYDATYGVVWRWDETTAQFVPPDVYDGTIAGLQSISGASAAPAGWTVTETNGGGTASVTQSGSDVVLSASTSGAGSTIANIGVADLSLSSAGNAYMRMITQVTTLTAGTSGGGVTALYLLADGTDGYDFGSRALPSAAPGTTTGGWYDAAVAAIRYAAQADINQDISTVATLLEIRKIGAKTEARAGGAASTWQAIAGSTVRNEAAKSFLFQAFASRTVGTATAVFTLRDVRVMRY